MTQNPQPSAAPATLAAPAVQPDPDQAADAITYAVLLAAFAEFGVSKTAFAAAFAAVALTDAIADEESDADARPVQGS